MTNKVMWIDLKCLFYVKKSQFILYIVYVFSLGPPLAGSSAQNHSFGSHCSSLKSIHVLGRILEIIFETNRLVCIFMTNKMRCLTIGVHLKFTIYSHQPPVWWLGVKPQTVENYFDYSNNMYQSSIYLSKPSARLLQTKVQIVVQCLQGLSLNYGGAICFRTWVSALNL